MALILEGGLLLRLSMNSLFQEFVISNEDLRLNRATHLPEDKKTEHTAKCIFSVGLCICFFREI